MVASPLDSAETNCAGIIATHRHPFKAKAFRLIQEIAEKAA
jgi:hypothetical protein